MSRSILRFLMPFSFAVPAVLCGETVLESPARVADAHWTSSVQYENDVIEGNDDNYTSGLRINWVSPDLAGGEAAGGFRGFLWQAAALIPFSGGDSVRRSASLSLGQNIYTPWNIWAEVPPANDRPYCGWLYAAAALATSAENWTNVVELEVGVTGEWAQARQAQSLIHSLHLNRKNPAWKYQIGNEVQANLAFERRQRVLKFGDSTGPAADFIASAGGCLGTLFTYERLGATARLGWNLPADFAGGPIRPAGDRGAPTSSGDPRLREARGWSLVFFCDYGVKSVQRDGTLDGNYSRESVRVPKKPFVQDFSLGMNAVFGKWAVSVAQVERSQEYRGQLFGWQTFHSITIAYTH
jgi:hypothetical protein